MKISDTFLMEGYNIFDGNVNSYRETSSFARKNEILTSSCTKTWFLYPGFNNNNNNNNNNSNNNINSNNNKPGFVLSLFLDLLPKPRLLFL